MKLIKKTCNLFILLLSCSVIVGCTKVPAQRTINLIETNNSSINRASQKQKMLKKNNCLIKIHKVIDNRNYKNNIGIFCDSEIITNDLSGWISRSLVALENTPQLLNENEILLDVFIKKLYIKHIGTSKVATIVLQVDYIKNKNLTLSRIYRKQLATINWNATENEIVTLLNNVLKLVMDDIINDVVSLI